MKNFSMEAYYTMDKPWKLFLIFGHLFLLAVWTVLLYGIIYYINFGINELKRNILDYLAINTYLFAIGELYGGKAPFINVPSES